MSTRIRRNKLVKHTVRNLVHDLSVPDKYKHELNSMVGQLVRHGQNFKSDVKNLGRFMQIVRANLSKYFNFSLFTHRQMFEQIVHHVQIEIEESKIRKKPEKVLPKPEKKPIRKHFTPKVINLVEKLGGIAEEEITRFGSTSSVYTATVDHLIEVIYTPKETEFVKRIERPSRYFTSTGLVSVHDVVVEANHTHRGTSAEVEILKSEARDIIKKSEFLLQTVSEHHRTKGSFLFNFFQRAKQGGERMIRELDVIAHSGPSKLHKK